MNRFLSLAVCSLAFVFFLLPEHVFAAEIIHTFASDIAVLPDSSLHITESVTYDFGKTERHGIFRFIPTTHPEPASAWYKERYTDIAVDSVMRDGAPEPYVVTNEQGRVNIKVGSADKTIVGSHVYIITYDVKGGLSYPYQLPPEVYWNVNGGGWDVPLEKVMATVHGTVGMFGKNRSCYKGNAGEGATCLMHAAPDGSGVFEAIGLAPGAQMTIAQNLIDGAVPKVVLERFRVEPSVIALVVALCIWLIGLLIYVYRYRTAYKTRATVIPQYEPYTGMLPMHTGVLTDASLDPKDITAGIVYCAAQGYIKIRKIERKVLFLFEVDDYEITLLKVPQDTTATSETGVLEILFDAPLSTPRVTTLGALKSDHSKQLQNHRFVQTLERGIIAELVSLGFYQTSSRRVHAVQLLVWAVTVLSLGAFFFHIFVPSVALISFLAVMGASSLIVLFMNRRLTAKGYEALAYLSGFKQFLSVTEKDRYAFHNAPEKSPEQFMEYLPYAIAFGVEEKWAAVFKDITIPAPSWYEGNNAGTFSATNLTTSLGGFSSALSASSGASAASGGGSAGGGGGGGGGGSW